MALVMPLVVLVGCTEVPGEPVSPSTATDDGVRTAVVARPTAPTTVLDVSSGADAAIAMSAALFRSAPVVVVTAEGDRPGAATGSVIAERLGVPMLLVVASPGGPATSAAPSQPAAGLTALRHELERLSPGAVLAVGIDARRGIESQFGSVPVFGIAATGDSVVPELPAGLPRTDRPEPVAVTVLVEAARNDTAANATARAAGAQIVTVHGADPRTDLEAIDALRAHPPSTVLALGKDFGPAARLRARLDVAVRAGQLPGGGQVVLPGRRLVCLYGHPDTPALGVLGEQDVDKSIQRVKQLAAQYEPLSDVPVVPAFEIIATVAHGAPGADGDYSGESSVASLRPWVERAGEAGLYVLLDLQPGRADLVVQAKRYEPLLRLAHVGLAVDPEWKLGPDQLPLEQIGGVDASEINRTTSWLAGLTAQNALPQKLFVIHQFRLSMIRDESSLVTTHDELAMVIHMDGQGSTSQKTSTWRSVVNARPDGVAMGWKNFYDEDDPVLTPEQTMAYQPTPMMISYQ